MYEADDFLTVEEVMGLFRCTDKHVHNMINAGRLQSIKVGRRRLILRASADDLINSELTKSA